MTREETADCIKVMQAYVEGKQIQYVDSETEDWTDIESPTWNWDLYDYRIMPKPQYRPFKDADECWQEMLKHQPFGWLREKKRNVRTQIGFMHTEGIQGTSGGSSNYKAFFDCFSFADGAPFGVKEEVWEN